MKKTLYSIKIIFICIFLIANTSLAKNDHFTQGKNFFDKKEFEKSKIFFERDIVFNPKSEKSYLYLAKIFNESQNDNEEEKNLQNVLLINPNNDEAIYLLVLFKIKKSDYKEAKELIERFDLVCKSFCSKKSEMEEKFNKLIPDNEKNNN
tara:strand:+ start:495 stop:944 length:450 start_codon:yes stop_codon:yes gene_type:complete